MSGKFMTDEERRINGEIERANRLKRLVLGRGHDGSLLGKNERVVSVEDFVDYLIQAGFAKTTNEARQKVLPQMGYVEMHYKLTRGIPYSYSIKVSKVSDDDGREGYRVSRLTG